MKTDMQIVEDYIDYYCERDFFNSLTVEEQILYKCQLVDTFSYALFKCYVIMKELFIDAGIINE